MPALPAFATSPQSGYEPLYPIRRIAAEVDALWQLTEQLTQLTARPVAALELITRTAGELTNAEAAAVLLHPGKELVLASRWGALGIPLGYKSTDVRSTLDAAWPMSTTMPIRRGAHPIGCLWIGRPAPAFSVDEQRILRTLAAVTSLALPGLTESRKAPPTAVAAPPVTSSAANAATAPALDPGAMMPETRRLSVFPPSLDTLMRAIDAAAEVDAIAAIVETDPVLSTLVLRAGNRAATGRARPAATLREAIVFLGLRRIRTLALAKFTQGLVAGRKPLDALLWEQAIGTAVRTRHALLALDRGRDEDAGLLAGLLHPIGAIALASSHPDRYERALRRSIIEDRPLEATERETFGADATSLTRQLVQAWHLGPAVAASEPDASDDRMSAALDWAAHVSLAANPVWQRFVTESGVAVRWVAARVVEATARLGFDEARARAVAIESAVAVDATRRLLALPT